MLSQTESHCSQGWKYGNRTQVCVCARARVQTYDRDLRLITKLIHILITALCCDSIEPNVSIDNDTLFVKELLQDVIIPHCLSATPPLALGALGAWAHAGYTHVVVHHVVLRTADNTAPIQVKQPLCGGQEAQAQVRGRSLAGMDNTEPATLLMAHGAQQCLYQHSIHIYTVVHTHTHTHVHTYEDSLPDTGRLQPPSHLG